MIHSGLLNGLVLAATALLSLACQPHNQNTELSMTESKNGNFLPGHPFQNSKKACFGRYAMDIPKEGSLLWGSISLPSKIEVMSADESAMRTRVSADVAELKWKDVSSEIVYDGEGPIHNSWQIRYYEDRFAREYNLFFFNTYVNKGVHTFILGDSTRRQETAENVVTRQALQAQSLRLRSSDEVPEEPGYCIEHGFMSNDAYASQEIVNVGVYFPSMPDVTFSVSSNKNAYKDHTSDEFEKEKRGQLSLLARIKAAQDQQGIHYPKRTVLREGKRTVQHWHGEESLIRRADGTHDFEWAFVGTPGDVANPSEFNVQMYTKVAHNTVGAADKASLTDEEAIALWDRLLSGLKFRVKVPGAPEGSYYFLPGAATASGAKP